MLFVLLYFSLAVSCDVSCYPSISRLVYPQLHNHFFLKVPVVKLIAMEKSCFYITRISETYPVTLIFSFTYMHRLL